MFGHRFFGTRYFGPRYWGDGGSGPVVPPVVPPTEEINPGGVGSIGRRRKPQAAPFPVHLYRPLRPIAEPPIEPPPPAPPKPEVTLGPSPLLAMLPAAPSKPVTIDIRAALLKEAQQIRDDEDALIAILLCA